MVELKTLGDLDQEACCHGIRKSELRAEAIKWIKKELAERNSKEIQDAGLFDYYAGRADSLIEIFDIGEKDLE